MTTALAARAKRVVGRGLLAVVLACGAVALVGCGPWEEPATPVSYRVPPPEPPSSEALAARAEARAAEQSTSGATLEGAASPGPGEIAVGASDDEYADTDPSALTEFKPALAPYGAWVDDSTYGTVWVPREEVVGAEFEPYVTAGRWTYSDATSWVWVSDYDWGWAPFHYGRWVRLPARGWAWIPGREYSGAWVTWRTGPVGYEYVGWAPAAPEWYWWNGVAVGWTFGWYHPHYVYCSHAYVYQPGFATYVVRSGPTYSHIHEHTRPYQAPPANGANGGRVIASPGVGGGDRVVASPTVGGDRVVASPTVGGDRTLATPKVAGPRPDELGVKAPVAAPPTSHAGLAKATAFATPRSAMAQGAAAPIQMQTRPRASEALVSSPSPGRGAGGQVSATAPTRFGGPGSSGYASRGIEPAARAPQVQGVAPSSRPVPDWRSPRSIGTDAYAPPSARAPSAAYGGGPSVSSPSYRPTPSSPSSPSPSYRSSAPSVSSPSPSYRSSAPSVSAPSRPSVSSSPTPSFRSASPSVSSPSRSSSPSSGSRSTSTRSSRGRR